MKERARLALLKKEASAIDTPKGKRSRRRDDTGAAARGSYNELLMQAGLAIPGKVYVVLCAIVAFLLGSFAMALGPFLAFFVGVSLFHYLGTGYLVERSEKRKRKIIPQFPGFIDGLASALGTGFNIEGAIIQAAESVPQGLLRQELDRVVSAINRGASVQEAVGLLRYRISGKEATSLAVAIGLFSSMGGTILEPFRRLAQKIRDQQAVLDKAQRDLVQIKMSFYILLGLSMGVPALLLVISPAYLKDAFHDSLGRILIQVALMTQLGVVLVFKKMLRIQM